MPANSFPFLATSTIPASFADEDIHVGKIAEGEDNEFSSLPGIKTCRVFILSSFDRTVEKKQVTNQIFNI